MIEFRELDFAYPAPAGAEPDTPLLFESFSLKIPAATRTLVMGANGVGKSTLLRLLAGRHILHRDSLRINGRSPFEDLNLAPEMALVDGDFPVYVDLKVSELLAHPTPGVDRRQEKELVELLEIDPAWRMSRASDGQRRRVQLLLALRKPVKLLLMDEITAHLDVVARTEFLAWIRGRAQANGMTILYATHVFDGLVERGREPWPTHLLFLQLRKPPRFVALGDVEELGEKSLYGVCESWIRNS